MMEFQLTTITKSDISKIASWRNSQKNILRQVRDIMPLEQKEWYENLHKDNTQQLYSLLYTKNKCMAYRLIGYCGLTRINYIYGTSEISYILKPSLYTTRAADIYPLSLAYCLTQLKNIAFNELNLHKIYTETYDFRTYHIQLLEKYGFVLEGRLKEHVYIDGKRVDSLIHGLIRKED